MVFDAIFERFAEFRPACVAYRALMQNILAPEAVDALFRRTAEKQYEREFLFSTLVNLVSQVVYLKVLRKTAAGALPGHSLVLLDPQRMVIDDVVCCEDGHAQERSLLKDLLPSIRKRDLLIDDRNFCTLGFLAALMEKKAFFITRQHGRMRSCSMPICRRRKSNSANYLPQAPSHLHRAGWKA